VSLVNGTAGNDNPVADLAGTGVTTVAEGRRATSDAALGIGAAMLVEVDVGMIVTDETFGIGTADVATGCCATEAEACCAPGADDGTLLTDPAAEATTGDGTLRTGIETDVTTAGVKWPILGKGAGVVIADVAATGG